MKTFLIIIFCILSAIQANAALPTMKLDAYIDSTKEGETVFYTNVILPTINTLTKLASMDEGQYVSTLLEYGYTPLVNEKGDIGYSNQNSIMNFYCYNLIQIQRINDKDVELAYTSLPETDFHKICIRKIFSELNQNQNCKAYGNILCFGKQWIAYELTDPVHNHIYTFLLEQNTYLINSFLYSTSDESDDNFEKIFAKIARLSNGDSNQQHSILVFNNPISKLVEPLQIQFQSSEDGHIKLGDLDEEQTKKMMEIAIEKGERIK